MAQLIDGKEIARTIREEIACDVQSLRVETSVTPGLSVIRVGDNEASRIYVLMKKKACAKVGIHSDEFHIAKDTPQSEIITLIHRLNHNTAVHGILIQLPLPDHLNEQAIISEIAPEKDVDGLTAFNMGRLLLNKPRFTPCTPYGIMTLLDRANIRCEGLHAVVVGRSNIVGKPVSLLLQKRHATVTMCHSRTRHLKAIVQSADILIAAIGKPRFFTGEDIKPGSVVIDVGINRLDDGQLVGDVDFESAQEKAAHITPVPGGVGPMTITMLMQNTLQSAQQFARDCR